MGAGRDKDVETTFKTPHGVVFKITKQAPKYLVRWLRELLNRYRNHFRGVAL